MITALTMLLSGGIKAWSEYRKGKVEVAKAKINKEVAVENAKAERAAAKDQNAHDWDMAALKDARESIKDEILMVIVYAPVVWAFYEAGSPEAGFEALKAMPWWYPWLLLGIAARVFAIRWVVEPILNRLGGKK